MNVYYDNSVRNIQDTSIVERFDLDYEKAVEKYPEAKEDIDLIYEKIQDTGYNKIYFYNFNSWFEINGKLQKGIGVFLDKDPAIYNSPGYTGYVTQFIEDGGNFQKTKEVDMNPCVNWTYDANGNKKDQLFPYVVSEAFPVDGEIRSQGIVEF
jgi:hypothetical protein